MNKETQTILKAIEELGKRVSEIEIRLSTGTGKRTIWEITKKLEANEKLSKEIRDAHCSELPLGVQWDSDYQREEYCKLRQEVRDLTRQLAEM